MKKFIIQLLALCFFIVLIFLLAFNNTITTNFLSLFIPTNQSFNKKEIQVVNDLNSPSRVKAVVKVDVADTKEKRTKGLGGRESLATDEGMLFIFDKPAQQVFWMKGMLIPLDFIWISGDRVVDILENRQPPAAGQADSTLEKYGPNTPVDKVLEVNANFIKEHNIQVGDRLEDVIQ